MQKWNEETQCWEGLPKGEKKTFTISTPITERISGYYWVLIGEIWRVYEWSADDDCWYNGSSMIPKRIIIQSYVFETPIPPPQFKQL